MNPEEKQKLMDAHKIRIEKKQEQDKEYLNRLRKLPLWFHYVVGVITKEDVLNAVQFGGMIPKELLEDAVCYEGLHRCTQSACWDKAKQRFIYTEKFSGNEEAPYPGDGRDGSEATFIPLHKIDMEDV